MGGCCTPGGGAEGTRPGWCVPHGQASARPRAWRRRELGGTRLRLPHALPREGTAESGPRLVCKAHAEVTVMAACEPV